MSNSIEQQMATIPPALDAALNVIVETREFVQANGPALTPGDRQRLAVTLEQMGRLCFSVARDIERPSSPATAGRDGR